MSLLRSDPYIDPGMVANLYQDPLAQIQEQYQTTTETPEQTLARGTAAQQMVDAGTAGPGSATRGTEASRMTPDQARQILAGINPTTGQYDPSIAQNTALVSQARTAFGYDTPMGAAGPRTVGGTPTANQAVTPEQINQVPGMGFTPGFETPGTIEGFGGPQPLNPRLYATEGTAQDIAGLLGGTAQLGPGVTSGPFTRDPRQQILLGGQTLNAGDLATRLQSLQTPYQQGLANARLNNNAAEYLATAMNPAERLRQQLEAEQSAAAESEANRQTEGARMRTQALSDRARGVGGYGGGLQGGLSGITVPAGGVYRGGGQGQPQQPQWDGGQGQLYDTGGLLVPGYRGGYSGGQQSPAGFGGGLNFATTRTCGVAATRASAAFHTAVVGAAVSLEATIMVSFRTH